MLKASCDWEDWVYNLTRPVKTLRVQVNDGQRRWQPRSAAMAAGLNAHLWTIEELMMKVVVPKTLRNIRDYTLEIKSLVVRSKAINLKN